MSFRYRWEGINALFLFITSFLPDEKNAIRSVSLYVQRTIDSTGDEHFLELPNEQHEEKLCESVFGLVFGIKEGASKGFSSFEFHDSVNIPIDISPTLEEKNSVNEVEERDSQNHRCLRMLLSIADKNYETSKPGYRFVDFSNIWTPLFTSYHSFLNASRRIISADPSDLKN